MLFGRSVKIAFAVSLVLSLTFFVLGCGREKNKTDYELGKGFFLASDYTQATIKLENWLQKKKNPYRIEANAMLAVIYHDTETRKADYEKEIEILKGYGNEGMVAVLKLVENPTIASRLQNPIDDILIAGGQLSVEPLMEVLKGQNWRLKVHAHQVLTKMGEPAVPALTAALNSPATDRFAKSMAIDALSKIKDLQSEPLIEQKLNDPDRLVRVSAAVALHAMGKENPTKIILAGLKDPDVEVRRVASKAMADLFENPPADQLVGLLKDQDPDIRNNATVAIGKTRTVETARLLTKAMRDDKSEEVRNSAGLALDSMGEVAVDPVIELLKNTNDMELTIRTAQILGNIGDKRAVPALEAAYKSSKRDLEKNEIAKALNKID
jgi:HEAT repeat protein